MYRYICLGNPRDYCATTPCLHKIPEGGWELITTQPRRELVEQLSVKLLSPVKASGPIFALVDGKLSAVEIDAFQSLEGPAKKPSIIYTPESLDTLVALPDHIEKILTTAKISYRRCGLCDWFDTDFKHWKECLECRRPICVDCLEGAAESDVICEFCEE